LSIDFGFAQVGPDRTLNLSNGNAVRVLTALGYEDIEPCGSLDIDDLLRRCELALNCAPLLPEFPDQVIEGDGKARLILCGLDRDGVYARIGWLQEVAQMAQAEGHDEITYA